MNEELRTDLNIHKEVTEFALKDVNNWIESLMKRVRELERMVLILDRRTKNVEI